MPDDHDKTRKDLAELILKGKVKPVSSLDVPAGDTMIAVCVRVADFNKTKDDAFWRWDANRSEPRDLVCGRCGQQVVMSNHLFKMYNEAATKPAICCQVCFAEGIKAGEGKHAT